MRPQNFWLMKKKQHVIALLRHFFCVITPKMNTVVLLLLLLCCWKVVFSHRPEYLWCYPWAWNFGFFEIFPPRAKQQSLFLSDHFIIFIFSKIQFIKRNLRRYSILSKNTKILGFFLKNNSSGHFPPALYQQKIIMYAFRKWSHYFHIKFTHYFYTLFPHFLFSWFLLFIFIILQHASPFHPSSMITLFEKYLHWTKNLVNFDSIPGSKWIWL